MAVDDTAERPITATVAEIAGDDYYVIRKLNRKVRVMSVVASVITDSNISVLAADGGILNFFTTKNGEVQGLIKGIAVTVALAVAIGLPVLRKFTFGSILLGVAIGGLMIWAVNNPDFLSGELEDETRAAPASAVSTSGVLPGSVDDVGEVFVL